MTSSAIPRAHPRKKTRISVTVLSVTTATGLPRDIGEARFLAHDIGVGGMGIETLAVLEMGDELAVKALLPGGRPISAWGVVKNLVQEERAGHLVRQAGLRFVKISDEDRKAILDYVGSGDFIV